MTSALIIARIFGPFLAILGLWMLLFGTHAAKIFNSIKNSPTAHYGSAVINLLLGLAVISSYNQWTPSLMVFITLLGWAMFVRGVLGLYMPHVISNTLFSTKWSKLMGVIPLIWGLILIWLGFYIIV